MHAFLSPRRVLALAVLFSVAGLAMPSFAQSRPESGFFDPVAVVDGIRIGRSDCATLEKKETAIWVFVDGTEACLRYYAAGLTAAPGPNPIVAIWLNGDVLGPGGPQRRQAAEWIWSSRNGLAGATAFKPLRGSIDLSRTARHLWELRKALHDARPSDRGQPRERGSGWIEEALWNSVLGARGT